MGISVLDVEKPILSLVKNIAEAYATLIVLTAEDLLYIVMRM